MRTLRRFRAGGCAACGRGYGAHRRGDPGRRGPAPRAVPHFRTGTPMTRPLLRTALLPLVPLAEAAVALRPADVALAHLASHLAAKAGAGEPLERIGRRCFEALTREPAALDRYLRRGLTRRPRHREIAPGAARETLADLYRHLPPAGIRPFLIFGTLLGAVRDGRFIARDSDIDLGVLGEAQLVGLHAALRRAGLPAGRVRRFAGRPSELKIVHPSGVKIDFKAFTPEPDRATSWIAHSGEIVYRKRYPRPLRPVPMRFLDLEVLVPENPEAFLEWQYGPGWRTPDPGYHMMTTGPVHGPAHAAFMRAAAPKAILRRLRSGRGPKVLGMVRNMAAAFPDDPLWPRLAAAVAASLARLGIPEPSAAVAPADAAG